MIKPEIILYSDLFSQTGYRAFSSTINFNSTDFSAKEKLELGSINCIELIINNNQATSLFSEFKRVISKMIQGQEYLVFNEGCIAPKTKIRSHKGYLKNKITSSIENEFEITKDCSVFMGILKLTDLNLNIAYKNILNSLCNFVVITTKEDFYSLPTLNNILAGCLIRKGDLLIINYLKLFLTYCDKESMVCRVGGDGGESYLSFQIFLKFHLTASKLEFLKSIFPVSARL